MPARTTSRARPSLGTIAHVPNPGVIYNNTCATGFFSSLLNGSTVIDDGRIPSTTRRPQHGIIDNYRVTGFEIGYCTRDLMGVFSVRVRFWEQDLQTSSGCTPLSSLPLRRPTSS
jgi:hypothetical protein